jgi:hypothetical protein
LEAISAADEVRPAAPRSCSETIRPRALEQLLLLERVADLDGGALVVVAVAARAELG